MLFVRFRIIYSGIIYDRISVRPGQSGDFGRTGVKRITDALSNEYGILFIIITKMTESF